VELEIIHKVFEMVAQFASYGFCKAHAATYAMLSYRGSYLKAHFPIEYMAAMLNNFAGYYNWRVYAEEARRFGAILKAPSINRPSKGCFVDGRDMHIGLAFVRNLSLDTIDNILSAHKIRKFQNLFDFLERVRPSTDEAENLIRVGALDCLGKTRPQLLWLFRTYGERRLKAASGQPLLEHLTIPEPELSFLPRLPDYSLTQRLKAENDIMEMSISCHPVEMINTGNGHIKSTMLPRLEGKRVQIIGMVVDRKRIKSADGRNMVFLTMEDEFDMFEVTLFPNVYQRVGERIFRKPILDIEGIVQTDLGGLTIVAEKVGVVE
jgi:DNA polymerase III alpha subunit